MADAPPGSATPRVSVIVPVRDRAALLCRLLDSLVEQTYRDFEVIVVDDGSTDASPDVVLADAAAGHPVRLVRNPGRGAYAARMAGVAASSAPYLAFTDSDCTAEPGWLAAGVAALDAGADVVSGLTRPERPARAFERTMGAGAEGLYPTCNVFYRREAFDRAGGFDLSASSRYGFRRGSVHAAMGFGEDALLAWRVLRSGSGAFAADAVVRHAVLPPDARDLLRRTWMMHAFPALVRDVPELRTMPLFRSRVFLGDPSRLPLYALVVALAARRRTPAAIAGAAWLALVARTLRGVPGSRVERLAALPAVAALDGVRATALALGSLRHRSVVL